MKSFHFVAIVLLVALASAQAASTGTSFLRGQQNRGSEGVVEVNVTRNIEATTTTIVEVVPTHKVRKAARGFRKTRAPKRKR